MFSFDGRRVIYLRCFLWQFKAHSQLPRFEGRLCSWGLLEIVQQVWLFSDHLLIEVLIESSVTLQNPDRMILAVHRVTVAAVIDIHLYHHERQFGVVVVRHQRSHPPLDDSSGNASEGRIVCVFHTLVQQKYALMDLDALPEKYEVPFTAGESLRPNSFIINVTVWLDSVHYFALLELRVPRRHRRECLEDAVLVARLEVHAQPAHRWFGFGNKNSTVTGDLQ